MEHSFPNPERAASATLGRRRALMALGGLALALQARAEPGYPVKAIRVVVPFGAGSSPDVIARFWGDRVSKLAGQPVVIDNKPGASTIIGGQTVASAAGDGYTLLYTVNNTTSINPFIYKHLPYRPEDFVPVTRIVSVPYVLVVPASSPYRSLADLIAAARAKPGALNYASYGVGQGTHVAMARLLNTAKVSMTHVPYKDATVPDLLAGRVTVSFEPSTTAIPLLQAGKLRALAVSGATRVDALPQIPAVAETYPGYVGDSWHGILAPAATPASVVDLVAGWSSRVVASSEFQAKVREYGLVPANEPPAEFKRFLRKDAENWAKVVRDNNIQAE
ncbi:MAG TPA: tripartite tricarboxylate transporter substrate binding protein [Ramlibacter sp.]|nr:tripartite tricarboxylate transporter substrate binding protein [Ramlibacter sp.]